MTSEVMLNRGMRVGQATPKKLRQAIVRAFHQDGLSYEQIAHLLDVVQATVSRVLRLHRETGDVTPRPREGGNFSPLRGAERDAPPNLWRRRILAALSSVVDVRRLVFLNESFYPCTWRAGACLLVLASATAPAQAPVPSQAPPRAPAPFSVPRLTPEGTALL